MKLNCGTMQYKVLAKVNLSFFFSLKLMSYISIAVIGFLEALTLRIVHRQKFPLQILTYLDMSTRFPAVYKSAFTLFFSGT